MDVLVVHCSMQTRVLIMSQHCGVLSPIPSLCIPCSAAQEYERCLKYIFPSCSKKAGKHIDQTFAIMDVKVRWAGVGECLAASAYVLGQLVLRVRPAATAPQ